MELLGRAAIEAAEDLPTKDVPVPEWGGTVRLRGLTGTQRDAFEASVVEMRGQTPKYKFENMRARLVALCLIDDEGNQLFPDAAAVKALGQKSAKPLVRLFEEAQKLSGLSDEDMEVLAQDFGSGPNAEDGSDSPAI